MKRAWIAAIFVSVCSITFTLSAAMAEELSQERLDAAEALLSQMDMEAVMTQSIDGTLDMQVRQNPQLLQFEDIMRSFMQKHMSWENLRPHFVRIYAEAFSTTELNEMRDFYRTDTGKKAAELTPMLMTKGMAIGEQAVAANMPELQRLLHERMRELNQSTLE